MLQPLPYQRMPVVPDKSLVGRDSRPYYADPHLVAAVNAAIVLGRPLLLTGEPGGGKTDFAYAVAHAVGNELLLCHVRSDSLARDLLYHYDGLQRFGDAQMDDESRVRSVDARRYVQLRELGLALIAPRRQVVLIDEIDKAPRDLPNDLLHELDSDSFEIKELLDHYDAPTPDDPDYARLVTRWGQPLQRVMRRPKPERDQSNTPIVIITSNVERQLPDPILRRCIFFHIAFPGPEQLNRILYAQVGESPYLDMLVPLFLALRSDEHKLSKKPATSELIDWARALRKLYHTADIQARLTPLDEHLRAHRKLPAQMWKQLPGLACLLKVREDLAAVVGV